MRSGQKVVHIRWISFASSVTSTLCSPKRAISRASWLNAFTTRTPGIVSERMSVTRDHFRQARMKRALSDSPCR